jgi:hypothetical protein
MAQLGRQPTKLLPAPLLQFHATPSDRLHLKKIPSPQKKKNLKKIPLITLSIDPGEKELAIEKTRLPSHDSLMRRVRHVRHETEFGKLEI